MAYTKTNLNETTETVAEQNARSYSKTVWNESTPITVDRLNKIEDGIASALPISGGTLTGKIDVPGESTFYRDTYVDPWENTACVIKASGNVGIGGSLKVNENLSFSNFGAGGNLNANIHNLALHAKTGDGQVLNVGEQGIYVGNTRASLTLESNTTPNINIGGTAYHLYHTGNKPTANEIGALPIGGGTLTGRLYVSGNSKTIGMGTGESDVFINNSRSGKYLQLKDNGTLSYDDKLIYHEGNFNPATKLDAGNFSISNRDLKIYGKRAMVGFNTGDGNYLSLNYDKDFAAGVRIHGLTLIESIETGGKLAFSSIGTGGGLHANIHNLALHANTGNGQMMTADNLKIYVGNPSTALAIESNTTPDVKVGNSVYKLYHTGNKPTARDIGALPLTGGTLTGGLTISGNSKNVVVGTGGSDVYIHNSASGKYLQLKDDGILSYSDNKIYHEGNKPTAAAIGALPLSGGTMTGTLYMQTSGQTQRRIAAIASHGGTDLGDNNSRTTIQSNQVPTWWNGNKNRAMLVFDKDNPSDYIVRCGAGLGGAASYITFTW